MGGGERGTSSSLENRGDLPPSPGKIRSSRRERRPLLVL